MSKKISVPVILGTAREGRRSEKAANLVFQELQKHSEIGTELIDVKDFRFFATKGEENDAMKRWKEIAECADAFVIVTPEYNHGYPGELKLLLDSAYDEYARKPVGICGVSIGETGGARAMENLVPVLKELGMVIVGTSIYFSNIQDIFDEKGNFKDMSYVKEIDEFLNELIWYAKILKKERVKLSLGGSASKSK